MCGAEEYSRKIFQKNVPDKYSRKIFQSNILGARAEGGGGEAAIKASKSPPWRFAGLYSPAIAPQSIGLPEPTKYVYEQKIVTFCYNANSGKKLNSIEPNIH